MAKAPAHLNSSMTLGRNYLADCNLQTKKKEKKPQTKHCCKNLMALMQLCTEAKKILPLLTGERWWPYTAARAFHHPEAVIADTLDWLKKKKKKGVPVRKNTELNIKQEVDTRFSCRGVRAQEGFTATRYLQGEGRGSREERGHELKSGSLRNTQRRLLMAEPVMTQQACFIFRCCGAGSTCSCPPPPHQRCLRNY